MTTNQTHQDSLVQQEYNHISNQNKRLLARVARRYKLDQDSIVWMLATPTFSNGERKCADYDSVPQYVKNDGLVREAPEWKDDEYFNFVPWEYTSKAKKILRKR